MSEDVADTVREGLAALTRLAAFERTHDSTEDRPSPRGRECDPFADTTGVSPLRFKGFVLACACAQAGQGDLALARWHRLAARAPWPQKDAWSVLEDLKDAIGHEAHRNLIVDQTRQEGTWEEHQAAHRGWLGRFPGPAVTAPVRAEIAALERTVREEATRLRPPRKPWSELTDAERADDLVGRLSEPFAFLIDPIDGRAMAAPGFTVPPREEWILPRLISLGDAAVPRLIEALTDER